MKLRLHVVVAEIVGAALGGWLVWKLVIEPLLTNLHRALG